MYISLLEEVVQYDGVIDNTISACQDYGLANILSIIQDIMTFMQIIMPILAIVAIIKILTHLVINPEDKKLKNSIRNWLISLLFFFFLPIIVDFVMGLMDPSFNISACWKEAQERRTKGTHENYQETEEEKNKKKLVNLGYFYIYNNFSIEKNNIL